MPCEHIPFIPHLDGFSEYRPRLGHRAHTEDSAMSDLTELGQDAIAAVSRDVADGAPLVKCQLLASVFYKALRHETPGRSERVSDFSTDRQEYQ
jgi:hypothetical protein